MADIDNTFIRKLIMPCWTILIIAIEGYDLLDINSTPGGTVYLIKDHAMGPCVCLCTFCSKCWKSVEY